MAESAPPTLQGGFRLLETRDLPGLRCFALRARHEPSGAELVFLRSPGDREKVFSAVFRTPPRDDTGVTHILEHCVLCGSRKFPLKDPFMELVKTSMATYINAVTYDDRTVYPCASLVERDFYNLMDVYMDAVFHPLLTRFSFLQEGHRLVPGPGRSGKRMGVVYSEMLGAYDDPDDYMDMKLRAGLLPGTAYGHSSGGDPDRMPRLSWRSLRRYHREHYHPSNGCLLVIADLPPEDVTRFLGERLSDFRSRGPRQEIPLAAPRKLPRSGVFPVPGTRKAGCTVIRGWRLPRCTDPVESLALGLLDEILLEGDAAPLREALIGSGLGSGLAPSGYEEGNLIPTFTAGLRGVARRDAPKVFRLLDRTLEACSRGLDAQDLQNALHGLELGLRVIGQRWTWIVLRAMARAWTHGENPLEDLERERQLEGLKTRLSQRPRYLEELLEDRLIGNSHHMDAVFTPDPDRFRNLSRERARRTAARCGSLTPPQRGRLQAEAEALRAYQEIPDPPEALASLPVLEPGHIPGAPGNIPWHHRSPGPGVHFLHAPCHTNGVCHLSLSLELSHLSPEDLALAQLAAETAAGSGAGDLSHQEASREELACSGGISTKITVHTPVTPPGVVHSAITFEVSCLEEDLPRLLTLLEKRVLHPRLDHPGRVLELGREFRSALRARFLEQSGTYALQEAMGVFRPGQEVVRVLTGLEMVRDTLRWTGLGGKRLSRRLLELWRRVVHRAPLVLSWAGPDPCEPLLEVFLEAHGGERLPLTPGGLPGKPPRVPRGIPVHSDMACVAGAFPGVELDDPLYEPLWVLVSLLEKGPLWNRIRGRIGAYGVSAGVSPGIVAFHTYRDPHPEESLEILRRTFHDPLGTVDLDPKTLRGAVYSILKRFDPLVRPSRAATVATDLFLRGIDAALLQRSWDRLLHLDADALVPAAEFLRQGIPGASLCVAGNRACLSRMGIVHMERF